MSKDMQLLNIGLAVSLEAKFTDRKSLALILNFDLNFGCFLARI